MRKRMISAICTLSMLFSVVLPVCAAPTSTVTSDIYFSAGGSGYSDTAYSPTYLLVPGSNTTYAYYNVKLTAFRFDGYAQNYKPAYVRFNFRPVKKTSHESAADVTHIFNRNDSDYGETYTGYAVSGKSLAMKTNTSYYESAGCGLTCEWYLYLASPASI